MPTALLVPPPPPWVQPRPGSLSACSPHTPGPQPPCSLQGPDAEAGRPGPACSSTHHLGAEAAMGELPHEGELAGLRSAQQVPPDALHGLQVVVPQPESRTCPSGRRTPVQVQTPGVLTPSGLRPAWAQEPAWGWGLGWGAAVPSASQTGRSLSTCRTLEGSSLMWKPPTP